jgi:integrase/recombinase XerD
VPSITPLLNTAYHSKDDKYPLVIRVHHDGKRKYIPTDIRLAESQFEGGKIVSHPNARLLNSQLSSKLAEIHKYIADCQLHNKKIRLDLIGTGQHSYSFTEYLDHRAAQYRSRGQIVMDRKLRRFAKELRDCFSGDVHFDDLNADALRTLDAYLVKAGNNNNTRHKKFKFLRQFFQQGFDEGKTDARNPFKEYKIAMTPVQKDRLTMEELKEIEQLPLSPGAVNDARNIFLFSYYTKGSRFASCITLRRDQIRDGRIHIQMDKGGKFISVAMHSRLKRILDQYKGKPLVFPFLSEIPEDPAEYLQAIDSRNVVVNRNLKIVAAAAGINKRLTMHVARHTFAQHLKESSVSMHAIKEALGHSDSRTTEIYLRSLGDESIDKEMEKVYGR